MGIPKSARFDPSGMLGSGCPVNIVYGARSTGKTYAFKKQAIKRYLKTGQTWIYLRTFDEEIKAILRKGSKAMFEDIEMNDEFPGYEFQTNGIQMMLRKKGGGKAKQKWETFGFMGSLTDSQKLKGVAHTKCWLIFFDEFILEKRVPPYPKNCVDSLMNLWETVDRRENRVTVVMAANSADMTNPYFSAWGIKPIKQGTHVFVKVGNARMWVENYYNKEFAKYAASSNIGQFTAGTAYSTYALENEFAAATGAFVKKRPKRSFMRSAFKFGGRFFYIYMDCDTPGDFQYYVEMYDKERALEQGLKMAVLAREDMSPEYQMIERCSPVMKQVKASFQYGSCHFQSDECRERFYELLELCGIK